MIHRIFFQKFLIFTFLMSVVTASSCRKCSVCKVYDSNGNLIVNNEKECGDKATRQKFESTKKTNADGIGGRYECETVNN
jgi:hypothetical protein